MAKVNSYPKRKSSWLLLAAFLLPQSALAQEVYAPPDEALWRDMVAAFANLNLPLSGHQAVQQIIANVQREAQARAKAKRQGEAKD